MNEPLTLTPLSRKQAEALHNSFSHLIGTSHNNLIIKEMTVGPYDDLNKWIFMHNYNDYQSIEKAVQYYEGPFYDVLLLLEDQHATMSFADLRSFIPGAATLEIVDENATNSTLS